MLCKSSVVKNLVKDNDKYAFYLKDINSFEIDAKKEFGINADACLLVSTLTEYKSEKFCKVRSFYSPEKNNNTFGWVKNKFVSDIELYDKYSYLDGKSILKWRQGVKHDALKVLVFTKYGDNFLNGYGEKLEFENELLYPFLKGSDLKNIIIKSANRKVIITQKKIGVDTSYILREYPFLWNYLLNHYEDFEKRKSKIYNGKPKFSIFGIGEYSFSKYKIAIAGMYKKINFALIFPINNKPVMLDDTSYFIGFESLNHAFYLWLILNSNLAKQFLYSISFINSKRPYTKDILMRLDLQNLTDSISYNEIKNIYKLISYKVDYNINENDFYLFKKFLISKDNETKELFV